MLGEAAGADHETAPQVAACDQLLDEEPRHDRLAGARVVGQQEPQRLARQHRLVDGRDLVRQRIDERGVHRQHRVEEVRQANAVCLGDESEERTVTVEAPRAALLDDRESSLVVTVQNLLGDATGRTAIHEREGLGPVPLDVDHRRGRIGQDAANGGAGGEVFELQAFTAHDLVYRVRTRPVEDGWGPYFRRRG